ncbi:MAG: S1-C subfamily serine protease [Candidatus Aldehydirespiratoraceae bacterium]
MTGSALYRRAAVLFIALIASACGDDGTSTSAASPTTIEEGVVPSDHGLSDELVAEVLPSTVGVSGVTCGRMSSGSGFALSNTLIVTNAHVIVGIDEIRVHTFEGETLMGVPVAFDADRDLAVLKVDGADFVPLPIADQANDGSTGLLIGWESAPFPNPTPYRIEKAVTVLIVPVGGTEPVERPAYLLAAEVDTGDSGAALVNQQGEVEGVVFATSVAGDGVGYAVRASALADVIATGFDPNLTIPPC